MGLNFWKKGREEWGEEGCRCLFCSNFTFSPICSHCLKELKTPPKFCREGNYFYFFRYEEIEPVLKLKYTSLGSWGLAQLASVTFKLFPPLPFPVYSIPIDPIPHRGFSHTAVLAKALPFKPIFGLVAQNRVSYAGKSRRFREENPRKFLYRGKRGIKGVVVDDLITTGTTFKEAVEVLERGEVEVLFGIFLATDQL